MAHTIDKGFAHVSDLLRASLGQEGWKVTESGRAAKAKWRWLSVKVDVRDGQWRVRLREGFPRLTIAEQRGADAIPVMQAIVEHARRTAAFTDGRLGLAYNPGKAWVAHRMWQAVRPMPSSAT